MGVLEPGFVTFGGLFLKIIDPSILKGQNFLNSIPFLHILMH